MVVVSVNLVVVQGDLWNEMVSVVLAIVGVMVNVLDVKGKVDFTSNKHFRYI